MLVFAGLFSEYVLEECSFRISFLPAERFFFLQVEASSPSCRTRPLSDVLLLACLGRNRPGVDTPRTRIAISTRARTGAANHVATWWDCRSADLALTAPHAEIDPISPSIAAPQSARVFTPFLRAALGHRTRFVPTRWAPRAAARFRRIWARLDRQSNRPARSGWVIIGGNRDGGTAAPESLTPAGLVLTRAATGQPCDQAGEPQIRHHQ
jgi:hypothetical protein